MTPLAGRPAHASHVALRRLYLARAVFAVVWAGALVAFHAKGPGTTTLLVVYALADAAAVAWQSRYAGAAGRPSGSEWANIAVSVAVAVALGVASSLSLRAALGVWGVWAVGAGVTQLLTALRRRRQGGQVAQMLSGGISVLAGLAFIAQAAGGADAIIGVAGYAAAGGVFFLASALAPALRHRGPRA